MHPVENLMQQEETKGYQRALNDMKSYLNAKLTKANSHMQVKTIIQTLNKITNLSKEATLHE